MIVCVFLLVSYGFIFNHLIQDAIKEFKQSRWVEPYNILATKTFVENLRYEEDFSFYLVAQMRLRREMAYQSHQWFIALFFVLAEAKEIAIVALKVRCNIISQKHFILCLLI